MFHLVYVAELICVRYTGSVENQDPKIKLKSDTRFCETPELTMLLSFHMTGCSEIVLFSGSQVNSRLFEFVQTPEFLRRACENTAERRDGEAAS